MKINSQLISATLLCIAMSPQVFAEAPALQSDSTLATAGYFQLSWKSNAEADFLLQEAADSEFTNANTLYTGPDTASLVSGRSDGVYYYRVKINDQAADTNAWSNVAKVEVTHHPLSRALMFFSLGAIVFIATLVVVVLGNKARND